MRVGRTQLSLLVSFLLSSACTRPPITSSPLPLPSSIVEHRPEALDAKQVAEVIGQDQVDPALDPRGAYRVGPGDALLVAVYGHPELSISTYGGAGLALQTGRASGLVIDNDGTIQFPLIGSVHVAGKTSAQLSGFLEVELGRYVKDPKVTVQVVFTGSLRYYLLGQFTAPGLKYSDRPLRLLEALSLGGSVVMEKASLRGAYVARGDKRLPINFRRLLREGDMKQNIPLHSGDIVVVPDNTSEVAFVFGGLPGGTARGGAVPFVNGQLEITQALAQVGFGFRERALGRLSRTRVIRSEGDRGEFITVDVAKILQGEAAPFHLLPGDVVYVPPTAFTSWNQALEQLLPTLQTVSGILNPYVTIKLLTKD